MQGPLISIIMPAYNCEKTIAASLLSVVNQIYSNWELIIIDDGSTEDLSKEIELFKDPRIQVVRPSRNGGVANALNLGLDLAVGRYIARMDADDYMEEWRLGEQLRFLLLEGLDFCGTAAEKFGDEWGLISNCRYGSEIINTLLVGNPFVHPTVMFDRARLGANLRYDGLFRCEEDYELWARLATAENCGNFRKVTIQYRVRAGGNANHPSKPKFNRLALDRFAARMGLAEIAPVAALNEYQMSGFVDEPNYRALVDYAQRADAHALPRLGHLQGALLAHGGYVGFIDWLDRHQCSIDAASSGKPNWSDHA